MADQKISAMSLAISAGGAVVPIVQGGENKKLSADQLGGVASATSAELAGVSAQAASALAAEIVNRIAGDVSVLSAVSIESAARAAADISLDGRVISIMSAVSVESASRAGADVSIMSAISTLTLDALANVSAPSPVDGQAVVWNSVQGQWVASTVAGGVASVTSAEFVSATVSIMSAISVESVARAAADTSLDGRVTSVMSAVSVESASRAAADISIMSAISVESAARAAADTSLDGRIISVMSALSVESASRVAADTSLDGRITSVMSAISTESASRAAADTSLDGRIISVMSALSVESAARVAQAVSIMSAVSVESAARAAQAVSIMSAISTLVLDSVANVSVPSPGDSQVLTWNSAQAQWVASTITAGVGSVTSTELSAVSANAKANADKGGGVVLNIVQGAQGISATGLIDISGLSVAFSTGGIYDIHAHIAYFLSTSVGNVRFGISTPGAVATHGFIWGNRGIGTGIALSSFMVHGAFNFTSAGNTVILSTTSVVSAVAQVGVVMDCLVISAVAGSFKMMAAVSTTAMPINILPGSFIRAYKIG